MTFDELQELHYITPIENMGPILKIGILSHHKAARIFHKSVAMDEIQERRKKVVVPGGRPLHHYVNLYFHARNPMMFKRKDFHKELCVVKVNKDVLNLPQVVITHGNASSDYVRFYTAADGLKAIDKERVFARYWNHDDPIEKFRHIFEKCAEVLVPEKVAVDFILGAYVSCEESKSKLYDIMKEIEPNFAITVNPDLFFQ
ncbi:MAG: DUF4433 domain-containing protein [Thermodesulfovibrionia bacterium]|nr:DUF4433 domain-containing protein [Thermodesulfovibrionia bacterium]